VLDAFAGGSAEDDEELDRLTPREREVMRLIARGYTYREVASELVLSVKTVETHVSAGAAQASAVGPARADRMGDGAQTRLISPT
jgi:FixJ family two-component response regulator